MRVLVHTILKCIFYISQVAFVPNKEGQNVSTSPLVHPAIEFCSHNYGENHKWSIILSKSSIFLPLNIIQWEFVIQKKHFEPRQRTAAWMCRHETDPRCNYISAHHSTILSSLFVIPLKHIFLRGKMFIIEVCTSAGSWVSPRKSFVRQEV